MKCFNCDQYSPMGYIYSLHLPKNTYHICSKCVSKAVGEDPMKSLEQPRNIREKKNYKLYLKVMNKLSKYEDIIF